MTKMKFFATTALTASMFAIPSFSVVAQDVEIEEIVVTGSYIRRPSQASSASPISILGSESLDDIGAKSIADLTRTLTTNTGAQNNPDAFTQNFSTGTSNINLRGLGVSSTLILLNGKRQVNSGAPTDQGLTFVDTSSLIPMIAIERVETLKDGAAAIYGSDAVAGVVNFITRSGFEGFEMSADYQSTTEDSQSDIRVQAIAGASTDRTSVMASFSYFDRNPLTTAQRRQPGSLNQVTGDFSNAGQPGSYILPTLPVGLSPALQAAWTAVFDSRGLVPGLADAFEPTVGLPVVAGALTPVFADFNCAEGQNSIVPATFPVGLCRLDFGSFYNLVPEETRVQGYAQFTHEISRDMEIYGEFGYSRNRASRGNSPSFPIATPLPIPATNPFNPYGANILFVGRPIGQGAPFDSHHESDTLRAQLGLRGEFGNGWSYDASYTYSSNDFYLTAGDTLVDRFTLALAGRGGPGCDPVNGLPGQGSCQFFNPFGTGISAAGGTVAWNTTDANGNPIVVNLPLNNTQSVIDDFTSLLISDVKTDQSVLDLVLAGDVTEFNGHTVSMAFGGQYIEAAHSANYDDNANSDNFLFLVGNPDFAASQNSFAAFTELNIPLHDRLELQAAIRYTTYNGSTGETLDPKIAARFELSDSVMMRASFGTAFRAPSIFQQNATQTALQQLADTLPGQPTTPAFKSVRTFGNPNLRPEQSEAFNVGFSFRPNTAFEFDIDYWNFKFTDVIIKENAQAIINANPNSAQIIRSNIGSLLQVNTNFTNAASLKTSGIDASVGYTLAMGEGSIRYGAEVTYIVNYDLVDPQAGAISGEGNRNFTNFGTSAPQLRGNFSMIWNYRGHGANMYIRYIGGYKDDQNANVEISKFISTDIQYSMQLGHLFDVAEGTKLTVGAINIMNAGPSYVATNSGFDSKVHDPRGRLVYARLVKSF